MNSDFTERFNAWRREQPEYLELVQAVKSRRPLRDLQRMGDAIGLSPLDVSALCNTRDIAVGQVEAAKGADSVQSTADEAEKHYRALCDRKENEVLSDGQRAQLNREINDARNRFESAKHDAIRARRASQCVQAAREAGLIDAPLCSVAR